MEREEKIEIRKAEIEQLSIDNLKIEYLNLYNINLQKTGLIEMLDSEIRELKELVKFTEISAAAGLIPTNK